MSAEKEKKALALKYPDGVEAPFITAKGAGYLAEKILEAARENKIPVKEDQNIINLLDSQEPGSMIPENAWEAVAILFAFIMKDSEKK
jgi:type III secretion system FlhB-like substrate exporter